MCDLVDRMQICRKYPSTNLRRMLLFVDKQYFLVDPDALDF